MGYNRSGTRRTQRMKRAKKQEERLAKKAAAAADTLTGKTEDAPASPKG